MTPRQETFWESYLDGVKEVLLVASVWLTVTTIVLGSLAGLGMFLIWATT